MRGILISLFIIFSIATEFVVVDSHVSHKDRKDLEVKAYKKFKLELLKMRKHLDHLKQRTTKQIIALKEKKKVEQKLLATVTEEKKIESKKLIDLVNQVKKLELSPKKNSLEIANATKSNNKIIKRTTQELKNIEEKLIEAKKEIRKQSVIVERLKKRMTKKEFKISGITKTIKRLQEKLKLIKIRIVNSVKIIDKKKKDYINKSMRQLERIAKVIAYKKAIKHIDRKLDEIEEESERQRLIRKQKSLKLSMVKLQQRVRIHKMRKIQLKKRWKEIAHVTLRMKQFKKGFLYDQKLRALEVKKAIAIVKSVQKEIEDLIIQSKKVGKTDGVEVEKLSQKKSNAMTQLEKAKTLFEEAQEKGEKKIRIYKKRILKLKLKDAKIRITEHQLNKDVAKNARNDFKLRIKKLRKLQKRGGLCPFNKLRIKRRMRLYKKEVHILTRKIKRNNKQIHTLKVRVESLNRRFRLIEKKRIGKIIRITNKLKGKLNYIRQNIMQIRVRRSSNLKSSLMIKLRTLKNKESSIKNTLKRYLKRNGHVLRKLESLRKQELQAAKIEYKNKSRRIKRLTLVIKKLEDKISAFKAKVNEFSSSPFKQVGVMRMMRKYVKLLENTKNKLKAEKQSKIIAKSKYEMLRTKAIARLHSRRGELFGKQGWLLSSLRAMAKQEKELHVEMKKTINEKEMRGLYKQQVLLRKEGRKIQRKLYRVVKKLQEIQKILVRQNQYNAIRRLKKSFKIYNKKFIKFELQKLALKRQIKVYEQQQAQLFVKQPYIKGVIEKNKFNEELKRVKGLISEIQTEFSTVEKQERRTIVRSLKLGREYESLLNVKLSDLKSRLILIQNERPIVSKKALYSIDVSEQRYAVRRLKTIDTTIEDLDRSIERTEKKIKKTKYVIGKLKAALVPKGTKCNAQTNCRICKKLGKVAKFGIVHHESDSIILNRLRNVCTRIDASRQKECYHQAMAVAMKALHTFDPVKFHVT